MDREKHMKYSITYLDEENEPIIFTSNILGNYFSESFWGNFRAQESPFSVNSVTLQIENYSQTNLTKCVNFVDKPLVKCLFWTLYFDGSRCNDGVGAGCVLISRDGEKTIITCQL